MAVGDATWKVGTLTVPASTGSVATTGLGGEPKAVFFWGTNWLTEDAAQTGNGLGLFRGMFAPKWDALGTLLQNAACVVATPSGNAHSNQNNAIRMLNTGGGTTALYVANGTSLDADGFTLNWTTAAAGGYKVVYAALMDVTNVGARVGLFNGTAISLGWKAGASLLHGAWAGPIDGSDRTQEFYGGGAYPGTTNTNWEGAGASIFTFPTSNSAQYNNELDNFTPHTKVTAGGHFSGPFLVASNIVCFPSGGGALHSLTIGGDTNDGGMVVAWDDEDSRTRRNTPATSQGGTTTQTGIPFEPGLLVGYTISDEPDGQGTGGRGAIGLSVVADGFQWCATVDGKSSQGAFQSFQRGFADVVNGTSVHAGTVELTEDGYILTTEEDDVAAKPVVFHIFGHPLREFLWIPQIYRRLFVGGYGANTVPAAMSSAGEPAALSVTGIEVTFAVTVEGFLLLENSDQIILEDGSGFLLL